MKLARRLSLPLAAAALLLAAAPGARAANCDVTYSGPANGSWSTDANWGGSQPTTAQVVCIPAGKGTIDVPASFTASSKTVQAQSPVKIEGTGKLLLFDATLADISTFSGVTVVPNGVLETGGSTIALTGDNLVNGTIHRTTLNNGGVQLNGGTLSGTGTIEGPFNNVGGTVEPGGANVVGTLTFGSLFSQQDTATLALDLASDSSFDRLSDTAGDVFFSGNILVRVLGSYSPVVGTTWDFVSGAPGVDFFETPHVTPSQFSAYSVSGGAELSLNATLPPPTTTPPTTTPPATTPPATTPATTPTVDPVALACTNQRLVLEDVFQRGGHVVLTGAAAADVIGKQVTILFQDKKAVATATVQPDGTFSTTAALPPAKLRNSSSARYQAVAGSLKSLDLKLARRVILQPPTRSGASVVLQGQVVAPLAKPVASVKISQQLNCRTTTIVKTFKPSKSGRFRVTIPAPSGTGAVYRLSTAVRRTKTAKRTSKTFSLPLPLLL